MDYLETLRNDAKLAEEFDMLFDFCLLDGLEERDTAEGRCTFSLPGQSLCSRWCRWRISSIRGWLYRVYE